MNEEIRLICFVIVLCLFVLLIANIEMLINEYSSVYDVEVPKKYIIVKNDLFKKPVYIYNKDKVHKHDIHYLSGYNENEYTKKYISEHVASKLNNPIKELFTSLADVPWSKTPINTLYKSLSKSDDIINNVNPLIDIPKNNIYMLISLEDNNKETFISNNRIYFV